MATTKGKDKSVGKEKRVASPSNSRTTTTTKSTTNTSTTSSILHKASSTTTTEKQVPSYLRPTISSRHESFKYVKKTGTVDTQQKVTLNRRSFDKPPSDSRLRSALVSLGPRERTVTVSSTSFSPRSTTSLESIVERTAKTYKAGKPQASYAKTMKNSTNPVTKKETNASASTNAPKNVDIAETLSLETTEDDGDFLVREVEEIVKVEGDAESPSEVPKYENDQHSAVVDSEVNNSEDEKLKSCDIPEVSEEIRANPDVQIEEAGDKLPKEKAESPTAGEDNGSSKDESNESHLEESMESDAKVEVKEDKGEDDATDEDSGDENKNEGNTADENEGVDGGSEGLNWKEGQDVECGVEETKPVAENTASSKRQVGQGKKASPAYNDVIEETASKLLEKRKNKVKALVGAFETVIDKEASSK